MADASYDHCDPLNAPIAVKLLQLSCHGLWRRHSRRFARAVMPAIFPAPDHDHARCSAEAIAHAEAACADRGERLTTLRRLVLEAVASSHKPVGAYEIMDMLASSKRRPAPVTVYRALDFLMKNGLVHRIESRNAYFACAHNHDSGAIVAFLMCDTCGSVGEATTAGMGQLLAGVARKAGFKPSVSVIEITGTCAHCRGS
jgi:Fur family transcriptional regulator, zinc uptake regulator